MIKKFVVKDISVSQNSYFVRFEADGVERFGEAQEAYEFANYADAEDVSRHLIDESNSSRKLAVEGVFVRAETGAPREVPQSGIETRLTF